MQYIYAYLRMRTQCRLKQTHCCEFNIIAWSYLNI